MILVIYNHAVSIIVLVTIRALFFAGLAVSSRHTYMFSAGDDKQVKCWDLEQNKVGISIKPTVLELYFFFQ